MSNADLLLGREPMDTAIPSRRKRASKAPRPSETQVANSIRNRLALHGCICQVNPNEARSAAAGRGMKILGTILGFPDLTVICPGGRVAFLEVKKPGAKPSGPKQAAHWQRQAETRATLARMGHVAALVNDQDQAVDVLRQAGMIR